MLLDFCIWMNEIQRSYSNCQGKCAKLSNQGKLSKIALFQVYEIVWFTKLLFHTQACSSMSTCLWFHWTNLVMLELTSHKIGLSPDVLCCWRTYSSLSFGGVKRTMVSLPGQKVVHLSPDLFAVGPWHDGPDDQTTNKKIISDHVNPRKKKRFMSI